MQRSESVDRSGKAVSAEHIAEVSRSLRDEIEGLEAREQRPTGTSLLLREALEVIVEQRRRIKGMESAQSPGNVLRHVKALQGSLDKFELWLEEEDD